MLKLSHAKAIEERTSKGLDFVVCRSCQGRGNMAALLSNKIDMSLITCGMCNGWQFIHREKLDWIKAGKKMRSERIERGVGLREEARHLGISVVRLSRMECGCIQPTPPVCANR